MILRLPKLVAAAVALALVAAGVALTPAAAQISGPDTTDGDGGGKDPWTFLVYMVADTTNIEESLLVDMLEPMTEAGSTDDLNVVALVDRASDQYDGPILNIPDFDTTKMLRVESGGYTELADYGEVDMADSQTLAWFIAEGMKQFPAERYAVAIADHGGGIDGAAWDQSSPPDADGDEANLDLTEIPGALDAALRHAGEDKIDLLTYAACLMGTYDAASAVAPYVDYFLASEDVSIGPQWDFSGTLSLLAANPDIGIPEALQPLMDRTTEITAHIPWLTMSLLDLRQIPMVDQALESFSTAVRDDLANVATTLGRAQSATIHFGVQGEDRDWYHLYDLFDLLVRMDNLPPAVATARDALANAARGVVASNATGPGSEEATGLSLYFPPTAGEYDPKYASLAVSGSWDALLREYYDAATEQDQTRPGELAFTSPDADVVVDASGILASARVMPGAEQSIIGADLFAGTTLQDGSVAHLLITPASVDAGEVGIIAGGWDFSYAELTDGVTTLTASTLFEPSAGGMRATIPVIYQSPGGEQSNAVVQVLITDTGATAPTIMQTDATAGSGPITPEPGALIAPLVFVVSQGGEPSYELLSSDGVDASTFSLNVARLASGFEAVATLVAFDAAGNEAIATGRGLVP